MKRSLPLLITMMLISFTIKAQVITQFTWDSNPATKAKVGNNAISISSSATVSAYGTGKSGLNSGTPKSDIDLVLTGSDFDVPGIDIAIDFRRKESVASFFTRGAIFDFGMNNGNLFVNFSVKNGSGGSTAVSSGTIATVADDNTFHNYRFYYDSLSGKARVYVDGAVVYTYTGTVKRALYWTGAGNVTIGKQADAAGDNTSIFDNLLIAKVITTTSTLPVKLLSFSAEAKGTEVLTKWSSTKEENMHAYQVERSTDGINYSAIGQVTPSNGYASANQYQFTDKTPGKQVNYYRLKMVDIDGQFSYSDVKVINLATAAVDVSCYPNPAVDHVAIRVSNNSAASYVYKISTPDGRTLEARTVKLAAGTQVINVDLSKSTYRGLLIVELINADSNQQQAFKIVKK